jgi:hypothetical protein
VTAGNGDPLAYRRVRRCSHPYHRTWYSAARCAWRKAEWITGQGPWATLAHCRGVLTITLHGTRRDAEQSLREIDRLGCGSGCGRMHEIVLIEEEAVA